VAVRRSTTGIRRPRGEAGGLTSRRLRRPGSAIGQLLNTNCIMHICFVPYLEQIHLFLLLDFV
jgi:hypothetical protein